MPNSCENVLYIAQVNDLTSWSYLIAALRVNNSLSCCVQLLGLTTHYRES